MTLHRPYTSRPARPVVIPAHSQAFALFKQLISMGCSIPYARAIARASL